MEHKYKFLFVGILGGILLGSACFASGEQVKKLKFNPTDGGVEFEIQYNGDVHFNVLELNATKQVVVEADHVMLAPEQTKIIDVSNLDSPVIQITPYNSGGKDQKAKFVIQLKQQLKPSLRQLPGKFVLHFASSKEQPPALARNDIAGASAKKKYHSPIAPEWVEADSVKSRASADDKSNDIAKQLMETLDAPADQKVYHGSRVSFEASNADVHDIFRLVGEASGLNVLTTSDVKASISLSLKDLPWDQLLDIVLQQNQLRANVLGNVVRISTLDQFNKEQEEKKIAIRLGEELDPVIMAIIPLSYAKAPTMKTMITSLITKSAGGGAGAVVAGAGVGAASGAAKATDSLQAFVRGQIEIDDRSNSLIVTNTKDAIERIRRLVKELDVALPQVLIDSKIVVADENFSKTLGFAAGAYASNSANSQGVSLSYNGGAVGSGTTASTTGSNGSAPSFTVTSGSGTGAIGFQQLIGPNLNLNMALNIGETNGISKTVGSPRVIVNNKQTATISDGVQIPTVTPGTANTPPTTTYTSASLNLTVTPQITSAGSVLMDVSIHKDSLSSSVAGGIDTKTLNTQVLVDSGATLVLGGVYQYTGDSSSVGIPGLMDLPVIGPLFRTDKKSSSKEELMVFITPQILDTGAQGITDKM